MQLNSQQIIRPKPKLSFLSVFNSVVVLWTFLPLRILIQLMSIFLLRPKYQMILNKLMAFSMIQSMIFVITLWHSQLQMSPSLTHKCCVSAIISNFLRLWKLNSMIMKVKSTGCSCCAKTYLLDQKQLWLFGCSNKNNFLTALSINTNLASVHMEVSKLGVRPNGTHMLQLYLGLAFVCFLLWQKSMVFNQKILILYLLSQKQIGCTSLHGIVCWCQSSWCFWYWLPQISSQAQQKSLWTQASRIQLVQKNMRGTHCSRLYSKSSQLS